MWWLVALLGCAGVSLATPVVIGRLPPPEDETREDRAGASPYAGLATVRFTLIVAVASLAALVLGLASTDPARWLAWTALGTIGVLAGVIDAHTRYLPRRLTAALGVVVAAGLGVLALTAPLAALTALAVGLGARALFWLLYRVGGGLGFGDVRLVGPVAAVAATVSLNLALTALLLGSLLGLVVALLARWRRGQDGPVPYGPALLAGPYLALLAGALVG